MGPEKDFKCALRELLPDQPWDVLLSRNMVCIHTHIHTCTHRLSAHGVYTHTHIHTCTHYTLGTWCVYVEVRICVCVHMCVCVYVYACVHVCPISPGIFCSLAACLCLCSQVCVCNATVSARLCLSVFRCIRRQLSLGLYLLLYLYPHLFLFLSSHSRALARAHTHTNTARTQALDLFCLPTHARAHTLSTYTHSSSLLSFSVKHVQEEHTEGRYRL